jgi:recombinational DNA repair protein (RecF pathway)
MKDKIETEKCVFCGRNTGVSINTHIDSRKTYVEGAGQLCAECFKETYNKVHKKDDNAGEKS